MVENEVKNDMARPQGAPDRDEKIVKVKDGIIVGVKAGRANITVYEGLDGRQAILLINVKAKKEAKLNNQSDGFGQDCFNNNIVQGQEKTYYLNDPISQKKNDWNI